MTSISNVEMEQPAPKPDEFRVVITREDFKVDKVVNQDQVRRILNILLNGYPI